MYEAFISEHFSDIPEDSLVAISNKDLRSVLFDVFGRRCFYTKRKLTKREMCIDHVVPKSLGGPDCIFNYVLTYKKLNTRKSNCFDKDSVVPVLYIVKTVYANKILREMRKITKAKDIEKTTKTKCVKTKKKQLEEMHPVIPMESYEDSDIFKLIKHKCFYLLAEEKYTHNIDNDDVYYTCILLRFCILFGFINNYIINNSNKDSYIETSFLYTNFNLFYDINDKNSICIQESLKSLFMYLTFFVQRYGGYHVYGGVCLLPCADFEKIGNEYYFSVSFNRRLFVFLHEIINKDIKTIDFPDDFINLLAEIRRTIPTETRRFIDRVVAFSYTETNIQNPIRYDLHENLENNTGDNFYGGAGI